MPFRPLFHAVSLLPHSGHWRGWLRRRLCSNIAIALLSVLSLAAVVSTPGFAGPTHSQQQASSQQQKNLAPQQPDEHTEFFESSVRPLLIDQCLSCHGSEKQSGGLRLDSRDAMLKGGDSGPALVPGDVAGSLIAQAIRYDGDLQMPPEKPLTAEQQKTIAHWIQQGAIWPDASKPLTSTGDSPAKTHWAFQPVTDPTPPTIDASLRGIARNEIDAFVLDRLRATQLGYSPEADRRTLIRRATFAVTGLPPTSEDVELFVGDADPSAYDRMIERLLSSPAYGQHWARRWLDIARYSDTKGYVYAREERFWVHAWNYRDWVVKTLNEDMPYDRFLLLQIAADQVEDRSEDDLAAMGFLTLGRRFLGVRRDIIDDRIDVVTRGTMSLTVGCARCHDHKYDPIPTADYYALYGVFDSCVENIVRLPSASEQDETFEADFAAKDAALRETLQSRRDTTQTRIRSRVFDYLKAQLDLSKYPEEGFDQVLATDDLLPSFVHRWRDYLRSAEKNSDPVFAAWHAFRKIPASEFASRATDVTALLQSMNEQQLNPRVAAAFTSPPQSMEDVAQTYAHVLGDVDIRWSAILVEAKAGEQAPPERLDDNADEQLRQVLYSEFGPCTVPDEPVVSTEYDFDSATCSELWKLQVEVDRSILNAGSQPRFAVVLNDRKKPMTPRIFRRGNSANKGDEVPRQFLALLSGPDRQPFQNGSGRLELAKAIIDPNNPLTARVIVNRIWAQYFGTGIVSTPGDFGVRAEAPSHPELLDWLTRRLMEDGWSLKSLHRRILLSAAFRQSSFGPGPEDENQLSHAMTVDPANRLLWRMNSHRLTFEEMRDSMLFVSGDLDLTPGGRAKDLFTAPYPVRRTLYGLVDRQFLPGTLRMFDFANPDLHIPQRSETTVPQQSLFLMNHPMVLERSRALAARVEGIEDQTLQVQELFRQALQREPTTEQLAGAIELLGSETAELQKIPATAADWHYGFGTFDETAQRVSSFQVLPHFTGTAWQGGPSFPDAALGWVQLSATGGHPGNDRNHAAIRRWKAPRSMTIRISSLLIHDAEPGDGIRAFIVSSRAGQLQSVTVHQKNAEMDIEAITVEAGETIDFVVDIGDVLNSDQYEWRCKIVATDPSDQTVDQTADQTADQTGANSPAQTSTEVSVRWNSEIDFTPNTTNTLTPLEQLAQVLLCSNEFLFVD